MGQASSSLICFALSLTHTVCGKQRLRNLEGLSAPHSEALLNILSPQELGERRHGEWPLSPDANDYHSDICMS